MVRDDEVFLISLQFADCNILLGNPNKVGRTEWPLYGTEGTVANLTVGGIEKVIDPAKNKRCDWWALGEVYGGLY